MSKVIKHPLIITLNGVGVYIKDTVKMEPSGKIMVFDNTIEEFKTTDEIKHGLKTFMPKMVALMDEQPNLEIWQITITLFYNNEPTVMTTDNYDIDETWDNLVKKIF